MILGFWDLGYDSTNFQAPEADLEHKELIRGFELFKGSSSPSTWHLASFRAMCIIEVRFCPAI